MNWITVFVGLAGYILASHIGISSGAVCSEAAMTSCSKLFTEKWTTTSGGNPFLYHTDEEFNEMCDDFEVYKKCLEPFKHECSSTEIATYDGVEDAYDYACGKGAIVYIRNSECYKSKAIQSDGMACADTFKEEKESLVPLLTTSIDQWKKRTCVSVNTLFNCIKQVVTTHCNEDLAEWQFTYEKNLLARSLRPIECSIVPTLFQGSNCILENLQSCFAPLLSYVGSLPNNGRQVEWYDQQQLSQICRLYNDAQECYSALDDSCNLNTRLQYEELEAEYEFMCREGPSVYNISSDCYQDSKLETSLVECVNRLNARSDPDTCRKLNDYMVCVTDAYYTVDTCSDVSINYQLNISRLVSIHFIENKRCRVHEQCTDVRERRCNQLLERHFTDYQNEFLEKTQADIDDMCQSRADKDLCMAPFAQYCPVRDRQVLRGFNEAARYICEDGGKAAYLQHMSCLSGAVRTEASHCYSRGMNTINAIEDRPEFPSITPELQQEYCRAIIDDLLGCVRGVLSQSCHRDMVEYQYTVDSLIWWLSLNKSGCETLEKTWPATEGPFTPSPTFSDPGSASYLRPFITIYLLCLFLCVQETDSRASR